MVDDCIFCKIIAGEIPSEQEHNDDKCVVFPDINPRARVHLLVIPKKHIPTIMDMEDGDEQIIGHMVKIAKEMAEKQGLEGYRLLISVGKKGGQEVFHVHLHLMAD
tara:strand:- start:624 stop:941 length:318 start_codon:yes stop_codon:yes gene_type:complete